MCDERNVTGNESRIIEEFNIFSIHYSALYNFALIFLITVLVNVLLTLNFTK